MKMKIGWSITLITILLVGISTSGSAFARGYRGHGHVGIYLGGPIGFGYYPYYRTPYYGTPYYGAPYYGYGTPYYGAPYYPAPAYYPPVQQAPVIYTERSDGPQTSVQAAPRITPQEVQQSWWYYCVDAKAYYPYVQQCAEGWLRVAPQPAPGPDNQPATKK